MRAATIVLLAGMTRAQQWSNPFCAVATQRDTITAGLECSPSSGVITHILFAAYGTPDVSGGCGAFRHTPSCDAPGFLDVVARACVNRTRCSVTVDHSTPDPCNEVVKSIALTAMCTSSPGGAPWSPPPPPPVLPSCATQDGTPPCPLPQPPWVRTWALNRSTICQPGNTKDFLDAAAAARWGLVSLDWSIASACHQLPA